MRSAFFNLRVLVGVFIASIGALLAVLAVGAFSNAPRANAQNANGTIGPPQTADDRDPTFRKRRDEFLQGFFGRGSSGVSPTQYATALAAARKLPASPLLQGQGFEPQASWSFPILPPITNSSGDATARVQAIAIDPTNTNVVYTGSDGGLAKTTDGGSTWRYLSDAWTSQSINCIAVDYNRTVPSSNNFVYVSTGRDDYGPYGVGVYRTFDGGSTWSGPLGAAQFLGTSIAAISTAGTGSQSNATLYVVNQWPLRDYVTQHTTGLWRSTNSGSTWTLLRQRGDPNGIGIYDVAIDTSTTPDTLYITEDDGVLKSTDSGQSWIQLPISVTAGSHDKLAVVTYRASTSLYLMQPSDANHNFYKSTDQGSHWTQIPTHCPPGGNCNGRTEIGFAVFGVDSANPQIILAGHYDFFQGSTSLWRTSNEGAAWNDVGSSIHVDQHAIAFSPTGSLVYEGNDGGIVKSTNTGSTGTNLNHNFSGALLYSVALSRDGSMIAGTQDHGVVYSNRGAVTGTPWNLIIGGDSSHDLIDPLGTMWAYEQVYWSGPGLDSNWYWFRRYNRITGDVYNIAPTQVISDNYCAFFPPFNMNLSSPTHLVAGCQYVARTLDGTASPVVWTTIGGVVAGGLGSVTSVYQAPSDSNIIYAIKNNFGADASTTVKVTVDANNGPSATWAPINSNLVSTGDMKAITVHPTDSHTAYLAADHGIYKTTNTGGSWNQIGIPDLVYHDIAIDPDQPQHVFAAANAGVFASTDGGTTWGTMSDGIPQGLAVTSLSLNPYIGRIAASTYGRGVYTHAR